MGERQPPWGFHPPGADFCHEALMNEGLLSLQGPLYRLFGLPSSASLQNIQSPEPALWPPCQTPWTSCHSCKRGAALLLLCSWALWSKVHLVLESLRLTHALCFESLLGQVVTWILILFTLKRPKQVRVGRQLPWERGASVCIKEEEVLRFENYMKKDHSIFSGTLSKTLLQHSLELVFRWPGTLERGGTW